MGGVDVFGGNGAAARVRQVETVAGIGHQDHVPAHVGAGADGGRDALIGGNAEGDDVLCPKPLQPQVEVGADEGRVDALGDQRLVALGP